MPRRRPIDAAPQRSGEATAGPTARILAAELVARSPADGHTLFLGGADTIVHAFLLAGRPPLDPFTDFISIARATRDDWMVVAAPAIGADTPAGLAKAARKRPGELTYASFGEVTLFHLLGARFAGRLGFEAVHVPYRGDYTPDLPGGRVSLPGAADRAAAAARRGRAAAGAGGALAGAAAGAAGRGHHR